MRSFRGPISRLLRLLPPLSVQLSESCGDFEINSVFRSYFPLFLRRPLSVGASLLPNLCDGNKGSFPCFRRRPMDNLATRGRGYGHSGGADQKSKALLPVAVPVDHAPYGERPPWERPIRDQERETRERAVELQRLQKAEIPWAILSGMGFGADETGVTAVRLAMELARVARTANHRTDQNTESPFVQCRR